ncbi:hypothetical protein EHM76_04875 [bacterium]|nr:MAG: hypothetical protein EHM76_04875 [bacterium]
MSDMEKAVEGGAAFVAQQQAQYAAEQANEAARVAGLPAATLPEGTFATKEEAVAYTQQALADGKYPQVVAEDGSGDLVLEMSSPFNGYDTVWITAVSDTDPNPPLNADMQPG